MINSIEITTQVGCPNSCEYCPQDVLKAAYGEKQRTLKWLDFIWCMNNIPADTEICFAGFCEPWANNGVENMIHLVASRGHEIIVNTTLACKLSLNLIKDVPFKKFQVHLLPNSGNGYLENVKHVIESNIKNLSFRAHMPISSEIQRAIEGYNFDGKKTLLSRARNLKAQARKAGGLAPCAQLGRHVLLPNGDVVLCCMDYGLKHKLGNLIEDDLEVIRKGNEFQKVLKGFEDDTIDTICRYCEKS